MFDNCIIDHTLKLPMSQVGKNLSDLIDSRTRFDLEGKCGPHGYVKPGSVKILQRNPGELIDIEFGRDLVFKMKVKAEICNPLPGLRMKAIVQAQNKIGALAEGGFFDNFGNLVPVVEIVLIKDTVMLQNEIPTEEIEAGDEVNVEILGRVYDIHDTRIRAFGRTVKTLEEKSAFASEIEVLQDQNPAPETDVNEVDIVIDENDEEEDEDDDSLDEEVSDIEDDDDDDLD